MPRDDFEHRLSQGLKRWAEGGEPTMDLEEAVRAHLGQVREPESAPALRPRRVRRWLRWAGGAAAAAAALVLALTVTFPSWAGAAAGWPLVGPIVTEIIMEDAGMAWAYEMGLMQGSVAELREDGITIRILGVLADSRRTTVLYQVQGAPVEPEASSEAQVPPARTDEPHGPPVRNLWGVDVHITAVDGEGGFSSMPAPTATPLGLIGTVSTMPLPREEAELELEFVVSGKKHSLTVRASRAATDQFSREVAVDRSQTIGGVTVAVESVIYTPAETIVRIREEKESFYGPLRVDPGEAVYLESGGRRFDVAAGGSGVNGEYYYAFPPVAGPGRIVVPAKVKAVPIEAVWPLEEGAVADVLGVPVTLTGYECIGRVVRFEWESPLEDHMRGIAGFRVIDGAGGVHEIGPGAAGWSSESNNASEIEGKLLRRYETELPEGVEPVAVMATQAAVPVYGPWTFELPE